MEKLEQPFESFVDGLENERRHRKTYEGKMLSLGVAAADDMMDGIYYDDIVVIPIMLGGGKTELAVHVAMTNALEGKRVHFFALECFRGEIQRRVKYKLIARKFYRQEAWKDYDAVPNYVDWFRGRQKKLTEHLEAEVDSQFHETLTNLFLRYRKGKFTAEDFRKEVLLVQDQTDLIIVDHLHFFDFNNPNENQALKDAIRTISDTAQLVGKPVVIFAQLRKTDKKNKTLIPDFDDIHGSSEIAKTATKIITFARARDQEAQSKYQFPTYIKLLKNRAANDRTRYAALANFNIRENKYDDNYLLGEISFVEDEFKIMESWNYPHWAKRPQ
jgi:replicative DNA helicase